MNGRKYKNRKFHQRHLTKNQKSSALRPTEKNEKSDRIQAVIERKGLKMFKHMPKSQDKICKNLEGYVTKN